MDKKTLYIIGGIAILGIGFYLYRRSRNKALPNTSPVPNDNPVSNLATDISLDIKQLTNPGIRNNNPLNIKWTADSRRDPWVGQTGESGAFVVFKDPVYGMRAAARILRTYASKGINNIASIVATWAPKSDNNDVKAYTDFVSRQTGIPSFTPITLADYPKVLQAMGRMETGKIYDMDLIKRGIALMDSQV